MTKATKTKRASLDDWLREEEEKPRRGRCYSCSYSGRKAIDAAARHFIKRRNEGATSLSWGTFFAQWVKPRHPGFRGTAASLLAHMEKCRGAKLKK